MTSKFQHGYIVSKYGQFISMFEKFLPLHLEMFNINCYNLRWLDIVMLTNKDGMHQI